LIAGSIVAYLITLPLTQTTLSGTSLEQPSDTMAPLASCPISAPGVMVSTIGVFVKNFNRLSDTASGTSRDVTLKSLSVERLTFGHLCLLNGFASYAPIQVLLSPCPNDCLNYNLGDPSLFAPVEKEGAGVWLKPCRLLDWMLSTVQCLCTSLCYKYHSFKLLELLYKRISKDIGALDINR